MVSVSEIFRPFRKISKSYLIFSYFFPYNIWFLYMSFATVQIKFISTCMN
jgi:hypothetical protein